ncbi:MAG: hypothetical protein K2G69_08675, partial [Muribaculaceae bacterium]|nr:hypothetical protein [Muribaculaceae bacterium]
MTSSQTDNISSLLQEFRSEADSKSPATAAAYHQAIRLFAAYHGLPYPFFTYLCLNGYTPKTAHHYNNIISSLLKKSHQDAQSLWEAQAVPGQARSRSHLNFQLSILNFKFQAPLSAELVTAVARATDPLILTSLLNGALPISRLVSLRISDLPSLTPQTRDLLARIISPKRKYIFPLNQSLLTPKQVRDKVETDLRASLRSLKIPIIGNVDETLRTIWTITALRLGHSPAEILSVIPHVPLGTPWMPDERSDNPGQVDPSLLIEEVGAALFNNPEEWFAMRLRPKVTFSLLTDRLSSICEAQPWGAQAGPAKPSGAEFISAAA